METINGYILQDVEQRLECMVETGVAAEISSGIDIDGLDLSEEDAVALKLVRIVLQHGGEPFTVNAAWFKYEIRPHGGGRWERHTGLVQWDEYTQQFGFPLPFKAIEILRGIRIDMSCDPSVWSKKWPGIDKRQPRNMEHLLELSIISASPFLTAVDEEPRPITVDPVLIARVVYKSREYCFQLAQWDLTLDLGMMGEK